MVVSCLTSFLTTGVIRVVILSCGGIMFHTYGAATEPGASCVLQPHACVTRGALVSGYVRIRLHCTLFTCNPYNYPSPLSLNYLEESHHMSIASWLLKQESTQIMNNLEQECLQQTP